MKKHMAVVAVAVALAGAAAVPAGSAFAKAKKPPSAVAKAAHCAILEAIDKSYDTQIAAPGIDPTKKAFLEALEDSNDARITSLGCTFVD